MSHAYGNTENRRSSILPNRSGKAAPIVLGIIVLAAIGVAVWWFVLRGGGGEAAKLVSSYIPKDVQVVGGVDVKGFYDSTVYKELGPDIEKKLSEDKNYKAMSEKSGFDYKKVETIVFGASDITAMMGRSGGDKKDPKFVAAVKGGWDAAKMMGYMKEMAGDKAEEKDVEGVKALADKKGKGTVGFIGDDVLLAATPDFFAQSVKLQKGTGESADNNADLKAVRGQIDEGATFWIAAVLPKEAMEAAPGAEMFGKASHAAISINFGSGIELKTAVKMASKEEATKAQSQIQMGIGMAGGFAAGVPEVGEDLKKLVDSVKVEVDGDMLKISASASQDVVKKLIDTGKKQGMMDELLHI